MKKILLIITLFAITGCSVFSPLQKRKFIAVFHLIENSQYEEARDVIEEMVNDENASQWPRTWYARGLLCQNAYREGIKEDEPELKELYTDQLYVAVYSYERARRIDQGSRTDRQLAPNYVLLANEFQELGERHFKKREYKEALRAFEQAIKITRSPVLSVETDKGLIYNAALAAYEGQKVEKSIGYLEKLDKKTYSSNVSHLLFSQYISNGDTLKAEKALRKGIEKYENNEDLVLLLSDHLFQKDEKEDALEVLNSAMKRDSLAYIFPYTKGLIYQKAGQYPEAIEAYEKAVVLEPDHLMAYVHIATSYFNIGVEIEEEARKLTLSSEVNQAKHETQAAFEAAAHWLDKAYEREPSGQITIMEMFDLYMALGINDKARRMQQMLQ